MNIEVELVEALRNDPKINFKRVSKDSLIGGTCPSCGHRELFVSTKNPYQVMCNRRNNCGYAESTRARYSYLFENLSERYPSDRQNPNATADAFMSVRRGFPVEKIRGWYEQASIKLDNGKFAETVRFHLWDGYYWDRLINEKDIRVFGDKAKIKAGTKFRSKGWQPPGQVIEKEDDVYIVEGIFHAIALWLAGYKVISAISCSNLPREIIEQHKDNEITWCLAFDNDEAGISECVKFFQELKELKQRMRAVLAEPGKDWDDIYREGKLDAEYIEQSKWRGRVATAESAHKKAFAMYSWRPFGHQVIDFRNKLYAVRVEMSGISKDLGEDKFSYYEHREIFARHATVTPISNCVPEFLHIEQDKFTEEQRYWFQVRLAYHRQKFLIGMGPNTLNEPKAFNTALLSMTPGGRFDGGATDLTFLMRKWTDREVPYVQTVPFIGYDETTKAYVFPRFGYKDGRLIKTNSHGYLTVGNIGLKTNLQSIPIKHSEQFDGFWVNDFVTVFHLNGIAALAFFTASLFTRQIKERHQAFAFLELTGEPEAGKSTLIRFLWKLFGRENYEGVDLLAMSPAAIGRTLSQLSNMPLVLLESDRAEPDANTGRGGRPSKSVDWDEFKKIYDLNGVLMSRGVKTNDNKTNDSIFRGSLVISQNDFVQASEAMMSRIVHLHCTTAHKRAENRPLADRLKTIDVAETAGYLHHCLTLESAYLSSFFSAFDHHRKRLTEHGVNSHRVIDCHAQVMASIDALQVVLPGLSKKVIEASHKHLLRRAEDRERRLAKDHPVLEQFWDTFHYLNEQVMHVDDEDGARDIDIERLNHSSDRSQIAINLNEFVEHCRKRGQENFPIQLIKQLLPKSHRHPFVGYKRVRSRITQGITRCWVFQKTSR